MARAPRSDQREPARFMRCWTRCFAEASTTPDPIAAAYTDWLRKRRCAMRGIAKRYFPAWRASV